MFGLGQLLLFHHDRDELRQRGDFLILHADDREEFEDHQEQKDRDADQRKRAVIHVKLLCHSADGVGPERKSDERKSDQDEQQCVAFFKSVSAEPSDCQQ